MNGSDSEYHAYRARVEMEHASRASGAKAAEAHRQLSALHRDRLRQVDESCDGFGFRRR